MDILVYGAGAVGGYLGGRLALAGHRVTLVLRPAVADAINANGFLISQEGGTRRAPVRAVGDLPVAFAGDARYDLIILGMKSYDLAAAVEELAAVGPGSAYLLSTQNGIGVEEIITARFGSERVLAGTVTIPISRVSAHHVTVERPGRGLGIAPVWSGHPLERWVELFAAAGIRAGACADYRAMKWSKAFLNIMGNASSAILNRPPAELYRRDDLFELEMRMLRETLAVMKRRGLAVINLPGASARPLARTLTYAPHFLRRVVFNQVIRHGRGDKMPSFHMDLVGGKGCSEVAFHNGAIAAAGQECGVPTPVNAALNDVLLMLARGELDRAAYDGRPDRLLADVRRYETTAGYAG
jgi:2-dehydropantoate 2-reductase